MFVGDVMGDTGRKMAIDFIPRLREKYNLDFVVTNIENAAGGFGITQSTFHELTRAQIDIFTGGNHSFDKKEGLSLYDDQPFLLRPANYPPGLPGNGHCFYSKSADLKLGVINLMGRTFMQPMDCPFRKADELVAELKKDCQVIMVDFHAEATSEKSAMGHYLDGQVSFVTGTHTHVQTADECILPGGTAYITDSGMTGPHDSVIGVQKQIVIERFLKGRGRKFEVAKEDPWLCAVVVEVEAKTGTAQSIERVRIERNKKETHP